MEGLSYEEMAEELGCDTKTIDNALQRVKRKVVQHQQSRQVLAVAGGRGGRANRAALCAIRMEERPTGRSVYTRAGDARPYTEVPRKGSAQDASPAPRARSTRRRSSSSWPERAPCKRDVAGSNPRLRLQLRRDFQRRRIARIAPSTGSFSIRNENARRYSCGSRSHHRGARRALGRPVRAARRREVGPSRRALGADRGPRTELRRAQAHAVFGPADEIIAKARAEDRLDRESERRYSRAA